MVDPTKSYSILEAVARNQPDATAIVHQDRSLSYRDLFDASSRFADKLGIRAKYVRLFFIYLSFATFGAGFGVYLILAFLLKFKDMIYGKRSSVFDL